VTKKQGHSGKPPLFKGLQSKAVRGIRAVLQRVSFVLELSADLEIGNHSAAGALAFLLSAVPALLLSFGLAGMILQLFPNGTRVFQHWIGRFLGPVHLPDAAPQIFGQGFFALGTLAAILGLVYSSRQFFSSIRKTLKVIWGSPDTAPSMFRSVSGYALELVSLVLAVAVLALSEATRTLVFANRHDLDPSVFSFMKVLVSGIPFVVLWAFVAVTLRRFPLQKPGRKATAVSSAVAVALFTLSAEILRVAINTNQYELLYGVVANLVVVLLNVSAFFSLYFMTAAYLFVEQHFDALLFGRYYRRWGQENLSFADKFLFRNPQRLKDLYGRGFDAGALLFQAGDQDKTVFFIETGEVEIVLPAGAAPSVVAVIRPGQIFGESALILGEPRNATVRAKTPLTVLELPPELFEFYLRTDRFASKRIIGTLADRLKRSNSRNTP
jgi:membrane protein